VSVRVERDPRAVTLVESNLKRCGVSDRYAIIRARFAGTERSAGSGSFDVIFLDPPYGEIDLLSAIDTAEPLVQEATLLIVEHARRDAGPESRGALVRTRLLTSGDSALAFYRQRTTGAT